MPRLSGVFDKFKDLETVQATEIASSPFHIKENIHSVENFIGNRILYPQTIAVTSGDLEFDFKILGEAVKHEPQVVFDQTAQNLTLTKEFTMRFPPFIKLVTVLIDAITPQGLVGLFMRNDRVRRLGTIVSSKLAKEALKDLKLGTHPSILVNGELKKLTMGTVNLLPYGQSPQLADREKQLKLKIGDNQEVIIPGGEMGIFIDLR